MSSVQDFAAILQQFRRGDYTNDPKDPNYSNHWRMVDPGADIIAESVPGVAVRQTPVGRIKQQVNIRYANDQVYLDTPDISAVGPIARLGMRGLREASLRDPMVAPRPEGTVSIDTPFVVNTQHGPVEVRPNPAAYVGRPSDLPARRQVNNLWHLLRGK